MTDTEKIVCYSSKEEIVGAMPEEPLGEETRGEEMWTRAFIVVSTGRNR